MNILSTLINYSSRTLEILFAFCVYLKMTGFFPFCDTDFCIKWDIYRVDIHVNNSSENYLENYLVNFSAF